MRRKGCVSPNTKEHRENAMGRVDGVSISSKQRTGEEPSDEVEAPIIVCLRRMRDESRMTSFLNEG